MHHSNLAVGLTSESRRDTTSNVRTVSDDGPTATDASIPLTKVMLGEDEERLVIQVLRSGQIAQGPMVKRLESLFAERCGVAHAIAVNSGTTALLAALKAHGIGPGDEVITSPLTFVATLNAILDCGATPRFADIDDVDFTIDPRSVRRLVNDRTRAILPVHLYGHPADMITLSLIAADAGLVVIEDAAQAIGARVGNQSVGSFGTGCFSLYATKNITTGEGGVVTTNDEGLADRIRLLRNQGMRVRYEYERLGYNWRLTDLQAAVGIPQLERLELVNAARAHNAAFLTRSLAGIRGLVTPRVVEGRTHAFHQYTVRVTRDAPIKRDELGAALMRVGIGSAVYYPRLVHDYECVRRRLARSPDPTPIAARAASEVISLPVHPALRAEDLDRIASAVRAAFRS